VSGEWQPIGAATKDGTPILATLEVRERDNKYWDTHVIWIDDETGDIHSETDAGWTVRDGYTHWMPLPKPPTTTA